MKIIVIKETSYNNAPKDALYNWMSGICMKADSALLKGGKPFFVPDYLGYFMAQPYWVIRLSRLGKSIPARFAYRYYDGVTLGINIYGDTLIEQFRKYNGFTDVAQSLDGTAVIGDFCDVKSLYENPALEVNGNIPAGWQRELTGDKVLLIVNTMIERLSSLMTLRQGDLMYVPALGDSFVIKPGLHINGAIGEKNVLDINIK